VTTTTQPVPDDLAGSRIDSVVAALWQLPRNQASRLVADGQATVNGKQVPKAHRVSAGDHIAVEEIVATPALTPPPVPPIMYDDEHLLIVDKPAGLVVHPGVGNATGTLVDALRTAGIPLAHSGDDTRPGIVHRLDKDTSGLLVIAKTTRAFDSIVAQLRERTMHRFYVALVAGVPKAPRGVIDGPIGRDPKARTRFAVVHGGKPARTHYQTREVGTVPEHPSQQLSLLDLTLDTGRTHQIRVHLATLGLGIVGDRVYGVTGTIAGKLGLNRPFLHAYAVALNHPETGEVLRVEAALPDELRVACQRAGVAW